MCCRILQSRICRCLVKSFPFLLCHSKSRTSPYSPIRRHRNELSESSYVNVPSKRPALSSAFSSSCPDHSFAFLPLSVELEKLTSPSPTLSIPGVSSVRSPTDQSSLGSLSQLSKPCQCKLESSLTSSVNIALLTPSELLSESHKAIPNLPVPREVLNVPVTPHSTSLQ